MALRFVHQRMLGLIGLACGALVAVLALRWQLSHQAATLESKERAQKLFTQADPNNIQTIAVTSPQGHVQLQRLSPSENPWRISAPRQLPADTGAVDGLLSAALNARLTGRVGGFGKEDDFQKPAAKVEQDLATFGLDAPRFVLTLTDKDGLAGEIVIGKRNSFDGSLYVRKAGSEQIGLISSDWLGQLDRDLLAWREKRPLVFRETEVGRLRIDNRARGEVIAIDKQEGRLVLTEPKKLPAKEDKVRSLISAISTMRATSFAVENANTPAQLRAYGLSPATYRVQLQFVARSDDPNLLPITSVETLRPNDVTLLFGIVEKDGHKRHYVAYEGDSTPVWELGADWVFRQLEAGRDTYRDMHLVHLEKAQVASFALHKGEHALWFDKPALEGNSALAPSAHWALNPSSVPAPAAEAASGDANNTPNASAAVVLSDSKVSSLLQRLLDLEGILIVDEAPSQKRLAAAKLTEQAPLRAVFYNQDKQPLGQWALGSEEAGAYFATSGARDVLMKVAKQDVDNLSLSVQDYAEPPAAASDS